MGGSGCAVPHLLHEDSFQPWRGQREEDSAELKPWWGLWLPEGCSRQGLWATFSPSTGSVSPNSL